MKNKKLSFNPFFLFKSAWIQTIMGWVLNVPRDSKSTTKVITLPDKDKIALEISTPDKWKEDHLTVIMVHGLCGSHKSATLKRMSKKLYDKDIRSIRLNLRGCGSGKGLAKNTYYCCGSEEIIEPLKVIKKEYPKSPIILVGFSLGGNIALKVAGELKDKACKYMKKIIALNPPIDVRASIKLLEHPQNKRYLNFFAKQIKQDISYLKETFTDFPDIILPEEITMADIGKSFILPFFGFNNIDEFYKTTSSKYVIDNIQIPCKVLLSKDDPLVSWESFNEIQIPENVEVYLTEMGGHLGYLSNFKDKRGFYWLDSLLLDWIES